MGADSREGRRGGRHRWRQPRRGLAALLARPAARTPINIIDPRWQQLKRDGPWHAFEVIKLWAAPAGAATTAGSNSGNPHRCPSPVQAGTRLTSAHADPAPTRARSRPHTRDRRLSCGLPVRPRQLRQTKVGCHRRTDKRTSCHRPDGPVPPTGCAHPSQGTAHTTHRAAACGTSWRPAARLGEVETPTRTHSRSPGQQQRASTPSIQSSSAWNMRSVWYTGCPTAPAPSGTQCRHVVPRPGQPLITSAPAKRSRRALPESRHGSDRNGEAHAPESVVA